MPWRPALIVFPDSISAPVPQTVPVAVPEGNGAPVVTDGMFAVGEWDDARRIALNESVELLLKEYRGVVFIGIRGLDKTLIGPVDLFLAAPGGPIRQLHRSAQLGEIELPETGGAPPFRFGFTSGWYANEERRDMKEAERLEKEGKNPFEVIRSASFPSEGAEFAIYRSKISGGVWRMRLEISVLAGDKPGLLVHPPAAQTRIIDGWLELRFKS